MPQHMTYAKAGVNQKKENLAVRTICAILEKTLRFREGKIGTVMEDMGFFANVVDIGDFALAICTDGVGTKVLVAQELERYDTIGMDLVAMNVNDIICLGAEPIGMVDYLAMERTDPALAREIGIGICEGAKQAGIVVIGGETATLSEVIRGIDNKGFELAGTAIGIVKKDKIINGEKISVGDIVLGFSSSGIHCNGLTLARHILPKDMWNMLMVPTRIYVKEVMELINRFDVHGLANITGNGFGNLNRLKTRLGFYLDRLPEPQMVFKKIQEMGPVEDKEMYHTFNMGIGFCVIVGKKDADSIIAEYGSKYNLKVIGRVVEEPGVKIVKNGKTICEIIDYS